MTLSTKTSRNTWVRFIIRLNVIIIGPRFNDEIYFYMSRGLIEPSILESIINQ